MTGAGARKLFAPAVSSIGGDVALCHDIGDRRDKAGQIVGATPYKQQIMQVMGVAIAALVMAPARRSDSWSRWC